MVLVRPSRIALGLVVVVSTLYVYGAAFHPRHQVPDHPYFEAPGPWVVAHRGGAALAPENTLEALRRAKALGVDVLEMDLRFTADGEIVLMHDATVDRTTNGKGRVANLTFAELQKLDAGHRFEDEAGRFPFRGRGLTVPSFPGVLRQFPNARLNVEMKDFTPAQARALCKLLVEHETHDRVLVSAFPRKSMAAFREACPGVATGATRPEAIAFYYLNRVGLGRLFRSPAVTMQLPPRFRGRTVVTPRLLAAARAGNRPVQVWTVNEEADMKRLLEMDVQGILTDRPDRLLALMGRTPRPAHR
jgi:glycerophosphoryl diester phosphodiesterase